MTPGKERDFVEPVLPSMDNVSLFRDHSILRIFHLQVGLPKYV